MKTNIYNKVKGLVKASPFYLLPLFTACSPESFDGADPNKIPTMDGVDFRMDVDQETNQMIATYIPQAGTYPIWILNGTQYSTLQEVGFQNPEAGTYSVELKLGNRNGFSQGSVVKNFTFNETKIDYSADFRRLCGRKACELLKLYFHGDRLGHRRPPGCSGHRCRRGSRRGSC